MRVKMVYKKHRGIYQFYSRAEKRRHKERFEALMIRVILLRDKIINMGKN